MNPGLPDGFVRFGSLAHRILIIMRDFGPQSGRMIEERIEGDDPSWQRHDRMAISANLGRMEKYGFLLKVGRERVPKTRSAAVYFFSPCRPKEYQIKNVTGAERLAAYRASKKLRVSSVFDFRSTIKLDSSV